MARVARALRRYLRSLWPRRPGESRTPERHRQRCEVAIAHLDHASTALQRHSGTLDDQIDTAAARLILSEAIAAVAAELRLRIVALEAVRQARLTNEALAASLLPPRR